MLIIANQQFFLCSLALEFVYDKVIHINENYIIAKKHAQKKRPF